MQIWTAFNSKTIIESNLYVDLYQLKQTSTQITTYIALYLIWMHPRFSFAPNQIPAHANNSSMRLTLEDGLISMHLKLDK